MITLPPYVYDVQTYPKLPIKHRWVYNKLVVAEKLGHNAGPTGTFPTAHGRFCLRPMQNIHGMGVGGWWDVDYVGDGIAMLRPGFFWCEWFEGEHSFSEYINDVFVGGLAGTTTESGLLEFHTMPVGFDLEPIFRGISRYLLVERIGGRVIEAAMHLMANNARPSVIADYKRFDPKYEPQDIQFGNSTFQRIVKAHGGYEWVDIRIGDPPWGD